MTIRNPRRLTLLAVLGIVAAGFVFEWWKDLKDWVVPKNFGTVVEGEIYRSGQMHRFLIERTLKDNDIDVIIDLSTDVEGDENPIAERQIADDIGVEKLDIWGLDGTGRGDIALYIEALLALDSKRKEGKTVLVHCSAGSQRTGGFFAFYRLLQGGWERDAVWDEYRNYRWHAPKKMHLPDYINAHMREVAAALESAGVIESVPDPLPVFGPPGYEPPVAGADKTPADG